VDTHSEVANEAIQKQPQFKSNRMKLRKLFKAGHHWWLMPIILAIQEAEIRRIEVQSQLRQTVCPAILKKNPSQKRSGGVAQGIGPEFKLQYCKKQNKNY
jgi:hypothetical protein